MRIENHSKIASRATATGDAMTFVSEDEVNNLRNIERFIERTFEPRMADGFAYTHRVTLETKPRTDGKKSKPGSSQRKRMKTQGPGQSHRPDAQSGPQNQPQHSGKNDSGKRENTYGGQRSGSKPKNRPTSWSNKKSHKSRRPRNG